MARMALILLSAAAVTASNVTHTSGLRYTAEEIKTLTAEWEKVWAEHLALNGTFLSSCSNDMHTRMPACVQACEEWCWATGVVEILAYHGKSDSGCSNECTIVGDVEGENCCPNDCRDCGADSGSSSDIMQGFKIGGYSGQHTSAMSQSQLDQTLSGGKPILVGVMWNSGFGGHIIAVGGCSSGKYYVHDPEESGWKLLSYSNIMNYQSDGKWAESFY